VPRKSVIPSTTTPMVFSGSLPSQALQSHARHPTLEAARCPEVAVANIDPEKLKRKQPVKVSNLSFQPCGCLPAPRGFAPSVEWQMQQQAAFSAMRQRTSSSTDTSARVSSARSCNVTTQPEAEDEEGWKRFCLGERRYGSRAQSEPPPAAAAAGVHDDPADGEELDLDFLKIGTPPLLSVVGNLGQATLIVVLEYLTVWFEERGFSEELGRWIYALLACIEKPLLPEAHSLLRQIARNCASLRASLESPEDSRLSALNLLICLVAR
uniref:Gem-associated protein 2 n=1 Tax=Petromyzon marinus TaxID=7757 RepID=S4RZY5_PETMA